VNEKPTFKKQWLLLDRFKIVDWKKINGSAQKIKYTAQISVLKKGTMSSPQDKTRRPIKETKKNQIFIFFYKKERKSALCDKV